MYILCEYQASQVVLVVKNLPANVGDIRDAGLIPGLGRTPGEGNGNPLQYSCLENPMDREAWQTTVHGIAYELIKEDAKKSLLKSKSVNKLGIELTYEVRIKDDNTGFVNKISAVDGVTNAVLVSYNGEYMS